MMITTTVASSGRGFCRRRVCSVRVEYIAVGIQETSRPLINSYIGKVCMQSAMHYVKSWHPEGNGSATFSRSGTRRYL